MEPALKQRLVGAGVLVALAVIFLPMLVQGPAPDSGASSIPLSVPDAPKGDFDTQDLPLVEPGATPAGGALGMPAPGTAATPSTDASQPADSGDMYPAASAAGDYAVEFGDFASAALADAAVASLRASHLPGYREAATNAQGQAVQRVRIGPFATRPDAESARLRASQAGGRGSLQVVVLDAATQAVAAPVAETVPAMAAPIPTEAPKAPAAVAKPSTPAASPKPVATAPNPVGPAPKPVAAAPASKPAAAGTGFAVQLAAFSKPADAAALRDRARAAGFSAFVETVNTDKGALTRVRLGPVATRADAERLQAQAQAKLGVAGAVRPHP
ncbi:MAG TPA: SPOR domain-containing protein [Luteimonas sp.]|nr:SPOR domain-containing protein [Luteimonas sp.]